MRLALTLAMASVWAGNAFAAEKLQIGPPADWVRPVQTPDAGDKPDSASIRLLLQDDQFDLKPGEQAHYHEIAYRIQTPQGLPAGAVSISWNPDLQSVKVHKVLIRRGAQVIDVLAAGQSFIVIRRENNLESAMLDGVLTATLQPEGLQVGDIVNVSTTLVDHDPALGAHVEEAGAGWNGLPIRHAHLRAQWPSSLKMRLRQMGDLPPLKPVDKDRLTSIELSLEDLKPLTPPKGAPLRYQYGRILEMTDFTGWSGVVDLMAPLYAKAATLPATGALQAEIARIRAQSPDPKARAAAALALVQDRVRYVFLGMNDGGLVPADAETTWSRRFGDCKGKTVLLLALLHGLDIEAEPVLVNSLYGDGLDVRLPMIDLFDHVLVRATLGGRAYWLDGTRQGDRSLDGIETPNFHWGLPLTPGAGRLTPITPPPLSRPNIEVSLRIDASKGVSIPAPTHVERLLRGDEAVSTHLSLANMTDDARDRALRDFWKEKYDFINVKSVSSTFDPLRRELNLVMDGDARMEWNNGYYEADGVGIGYKADFSRAPGTDQTAPFMVDYPVAYRGTETILLPQQSSAFTVDKSANVDTTVAGMTYHRHAEVTGDRFTVEESEASIAPEFPAAEAPAAEAALRALAKQNVYLKQPADYWATRAEVDAELAKTLKTSDEFIDRGNLLHDRGRLREAEKDYTKAVELDPKSAVALANRGLVRAKEDDVAGAQQDLDAAAALDAKNAVMFRGRGELALRTRNFKDAVAAFTTSLTIEPDNTFALIHRARAHYALDEYDPALADAAAVQTLNPRIVEPYVLSAFILRDSGRPEDAVRQAHALIARHPNDEYALSEAARIYASLDRPDDAIKTFDRALAVQPSDYIYLGRSRARPKADTAGRLADIDAALKLNPKYVDAMEDKADIALERKDPRAAAAALTAALAEDPNDRELLGKRGIAYARAGQTALAQKDFAAAHSLAKTAQQLNSLCWMKATSNVALAAALAECDAAIALQPDYAAVVDSRGFVLLRLGRYEEAIAAYSRALSLEPKLAASLYGRAVAQARLGRWSLADADHAAAVKIFAGVDTRFADYGAPYPPRPAAAKP